MGERSGSSTLVVTISHRTPVNIIVVIVDFSRRHFYSIMSQCLPNKEFCSLAGALSSKESSTCWVISDNDYLAFLGYGGNFIARRKAGRRAVTEATKSSLKYKKANFAKEVMNRYLFKNEPIINPEMVGPNEPKPPSNAIRLVCVLCFFHVLKCCVL